MSHKIFSLLLLISLLLAASTAPSLPSSTAHAQGDVGSAWFAQGIDPDQWYQDHEIEHSWTPAYLHLATGDPYSDDHGVYAWPYDLDSIGWSMQSYQDYGGTPYFHHGMDMMKMFGTDVFNRSGGQVVNIENYRPGWDLYWEVAVLDPDGYIWQYHHIDMPTIPQYIWDKYAEYQVDPVNGGFIPPDTYIGDIIEWPVWSFGKQFNHIHLNILAAGGIFVNGFEFHIPLPDTVGPEIQAVGLLRNGQIYPGDWIEGSYSLYVRARDLILDDVYYLPPWEITFSIDGGPEQTTWRFDTLPGGADEYAYLDDFYVVPPTCGNYDCREYYIDLGFIPDSQYVFPTTRGPHTLVATVRDYAGNSVSQAFTYNYDNYAPTADPQIVTTAEDTPLELALTGSDPDGDPLTYTLVTTPTHGTLGGLAPSLVYTPALDYHGPDGFTFTVSDGLDASAPASVGITVTPVNDAPQADPQSLSTPEEAPLQILLTGADPDGDPLTYTLISTPTHGLLGGLAPSLVYTPALDYNGADSFTFVVDDGSGPSVPAQVEIAVTPVNDVPLADPQSLSTLMGIPVDLVLTGTDPEGDPLTFTVVISPTHGALNGSGPSLTYTPAFGYAGADEFSFVANDGALNSAPAVVSIAIIGQQHAVYLPVIIR